MRAHLGAWQAWLLALLVPLLGARAAAAFLAALSPHPRLVQLGPYCVDEDTAADFSEAEIRLLIPFLFLIGPGPNRGMASHARTAPIPHRESARAPPRARSPSSRNPPKSAPRADDDSRPHYRKRLFFF